MKRVYKHLSMLLAALLSVSALSVSASAVVTWDTPYTSGGTTYYDGHSNTPLNGNISKTTNYMLSTFTHTSSSSLAIWNVVAKNTTQYSRYMTVCAEKYNKTSHSYSSSEYNSAVVAASSSVSVGSTCSLSNLAANIELIYRSNAYAGTYSGSTVLEAVKLEEVSV